MPPFRIAMLLLAGLCCSLCGCALPGAVGPRVVIEEARWADPVPREERDAAVLNVEIDVSNPGSHPLELRELRYHVTSGGRRLYTGRRAIPHTLAPGTAARLVIPAVIAFDEAGRDVDPARISLSGSVLYVSPGRLALIARDLGLPRPRAGFRGHADVR